MKKSGKFLRRNFKSFKVAFLEDGFIHSFGIKKDKIPLTICNDKNGIYYNSNSKQKSFYNDKTSRSFSDKKEDDPWI